MDDKMVRDLPSFYRNSGYVGDMLKDCLMKTEPVYWVRVNLDYPNSSRGIRFFSRGDFRPDAVEVVLELSPEESRYSYRKGSFPQDWERVILDSENVLFEIKGTHGLVLRIGAIDMKRVAKIAEGGQVKNPRYDEEGNQVLTRDEFLVEFRGSIADQLLNDNKYGPASQMILPPDEIELARMIKEAGEVFDHYSNFPVGSMIVTRDFIFPYVIGRKKSSELRWFSSRYSGYYSKGPSIPTTDPSVHLTGIHDHYAPHMFENPVFRANFGFPLSVILDTFIVPEPDEKGYVENTIQLMGRFNSIWVQNPPSNIHSDVTQPQGNNWSPKKDELIRVINEFLEI